MKKYFLPNC